MRSFVRALMEFSSMIEEEDGFILYFSGHGCNGDLCFSDGMINIQSIIDFVEKLKSKNKIIILDCCYSGKFYVSGVKQMKLEEAITLHHLMRVHGSDPGRTTVCIQEC